MRWVALALTYNGLLALCLAMPKHYRQVFPRHQPGVRASLFRLGGWLCLSASLAASVAVNGWAFGPVESVGMLAIAGLTLVFMLPYTPRIAALAGLAGLLSASIGLLL
ncbi:MAG: DUF3325 domain-containing protein [Nitrospiraceae bacterium]